MAYGVEFAKMKLEQVDKESYGKKKGKKELMYRKVTKYGYQKYVELKKISQIKWKSII